MTSALLLQSKGDSPSQQGLQTQSVFDEDLQKKIQENERLHIQVGSPPPLNFNYSWRGFLVNLLYKALTVENNGQNNVHSLPASLMQDALPLSAHGDIDMERNPTVVALD